MAISYRFTAKDKETYTTVGLMALNLPVTATLFPQSLTIVLPESDATRTLMDGIKESDVAIEVTTAEYRVSNRETLLKDPSSDTNILREIATSYKSELADNAYWYTQFSAMNERFGKVNERIKAIMVMLKSIEDV